MQIMKNTFNLISTIVLCFLVYGMFQGTLQNHIHFAGTLNEIGFTLMLIFLTIAQGMKLILK
jgi:hypothetical protein